MKANLGYFLIFPISLVLLANTAYLAFGVMFLSKQEYALNNFWVFLGYIGFIGILNIIFFCFIIVLINRFIKNTFLKPLDDFYGDVQNFYRTNKNGFVNWSQKIIKSPMKIVEFQHYFHNNIAKNIYELNLRISTDYLTGLRTSIVLRDDLEMNPNHIIAVVNISNFKEINSFYGIESADKILCAVANILRSYFANERCLLYRIHGDDFAILWPNYMDKDIFINKLEGFLDVLGRKEILIDGFSYINVVATIGLAFSYDSSKYSLVNALMALHHAKEYKNPIVIYNRHLPILNTLKNNIQYTEIIHQAIKNQDVIPYFQKIEAIKENSRNKKVKFEALMRIKDKEGHIIPPALFLDISKRSNAYSKLSRLMIEKSFATLALCDDCVFSVNLALQDMLEPDFSIWFVDRIAHYNIEERVVVEITEQESIKDFDNVSNFISTIKELGVKIALDDFGSGYSNFEILMKLPIDYLKIDGSLIKNIDKDKNAKIIVDTITSFAKKLGIATIAEFVSSKEIYEVVKEIGIDYAQGYFIGKPAPRAV